MEDGRDGADRVRIKLEAPGAEVGTYGVDVRKANVGQAKLGMIEGGQAGWEILLQIRLEHFR